MLSNVYSAKNSFQMHFSLLRVFKYMFSKNPSMDIKKTKKKSLFVKNPCLNRSNTFYKFFVLRFRGFISKFFMQNSYYSNLVVKSGLCNLTQTNFYKK